MDELQEISQNQKTPAVTFGKKCPKCKDFVEKRVRRKKWMRFFPGSKYYYCENCHITILYFLGICTVIRKKTVHGKPTNTHEA